MRDKRMAPDDGVENYLTQAEEVARSVRVAATLEKLKLLKDFRRYKEFKHQIEEENDDN
jgi:hypothetical protein